MLQFKPLGSKLVLRKVFVLLSSLLAGFVLLWLNIDANELLSDGPLVREELRKVTESVKASPQAAESGQASPQAAASGQASPQAAVSGQASPQAAESGQASPQAAESGQASPQAAESGQASPQTSESGQAPPFRGIDQQHSKPNWVQGLGGNEMVFIYSAFLDRRVKNAPCIRVVSLAHRKHVFVECSYWSASNQSATLTGNLIIIPEHHETSYSAAFVECPLPEFNHSTERGHNSTNKVQDDGNQDPVLRVSVSTVKGMSMDYAASIPVDDLASRKKVGELNVCVKQFHTHHNKAAKLVEFVEMYKILGADHFTFYNLSVGPDVADVLQFYVKEGVAAVMPFTSPALRKGEYHDKGTIACLNECNLWSVGRFPLVVMVDVDEFIVPKKTENLLELVEQLGSKDAVYIAKNAFFYLFYNDHTDVSTNSPVVTLLSETALKISPTKQSVSRAPMLPGRREDEPYLTTQRKITRVERPNVFNDRSKYICRPEKVLAAGNHIVHWWIGPNTVNYINESLALTHHYRDCEEHRCNCEKKPTTVDRSMHRYGARLTAAVTTACRAIFPHLQSCPTSIIKN